MYCPHGFAQTVWILWSLLKPPVEIVLKILPIKRSNHPVGNVLIGKSVVDLVEKSTRKCMHRVWVTKALSSILIVKWPWVMSKLQGQFRTKNGKILKNSFYQHTLLAHPKRMRTFFVFLTLLALYDIYAMINSYQKWFFFNFFLANRIFKFFICWSLLFFICFCCIERAHKFILSIDLNDVIT